MHMTIYFHTRWFVATCRPLTFSTPPISQSSCSRHLPQVVAQRNWRLSPTWRDLDDLLILVNGQDRLYVALCTTLLAGPYAGPTALGFSTVDGFAFSLLFFLARKQNVKIWHVSAQANGGICPMFLSVGIGVVIVLPNFENIGVNNCGYRFCILGGLMLMINIWIECIMLMIYHYFI